MEIINIEKNDFNKLLNTFEILINDFERVFSQNEIVAQRIGDIERGEMKGKSEEYYKEYYDKLQTFKNDRKLNLRCSDTRNRRITYTWLRGA